MSSFHQWIRASLALCLTASVCLCTGCKDESSLREMPKSDSFVRVGEDLVSVADTVTTVTQSAASTTVSTQTTSATDAERQTTPAAVSTTKAAVTTTKASEQTPILSTTTAGQVALFDALSLGMDCQAYVAEHPDFELHEAASCLGEGTDKIYTYDDYQIYTYDNGTTNAVMEIDITGTGAKTRKGATVGMTVAEIDALYGTSDGSHIYETSDGVVEFTFQNGTVQLIAVYYLQ